MVWVHCRRRLCCPTCRGWTGSQYCSDKFPAGESELGSEVTSDPGTDNLYYTTDRSVADKLTELYYPSSTKSTYCEDDYFLSLSKDRKTFKPIRVCEL